MTDKEIELLPVKLENRFKKLNTKFLKLIGKRIAQVGKLSQDDAHLLNVLAIVTEDMATIDTELAKISGKTEAELEEIYTKVAKSDYEFAEQFYKYRQLDYVPYSKKTQLTSYVKALVSQSSDDITNMAKTLACLTRNPATGGYKITDLSKVYNDVLDQAVVAVTSGTTDYSTAMTQTIKDLADSGLRTKYNPRGGAAGKAVDYASGYSRRLDTAVRQNILWGAKTCSQAITDMTGQEFGANGYEIDYHSNPRPSHEAMGGKQYIVGVTGKTIDGVYYPPFSEVESLLEDYGCLHFKTPIIVGVSQAAYSDEQLQSFKKSDARKIEYEGQTYTGYQATQVQRKLETASRHAQDRQIIALAAKNDTLANAEQEKINALASEYRKFSKAAGLPVKSERMQVSGYKALF